MKKLRIKIYFFKTIQMNIIKIILVLLSLTYSAFSQDMSFQIKMDSIVAEGDLLYRYEKSVWNSTDILMKNKKLFKNHGGYIAYNSGDSVFVTYLDKDQTGSIAKYTYVVPLLTMPTNTVTGYSPLTELERELFSIKVKIIDQLSDAKYDIRIPGSFNPNFVLIKGDKDFRLYMLMGTNESGLIPFGNDYLFMADKSGIITGWKKFHTRMIPTFSKTPDGQAVVSVIHSHLEMTPYITATDICTFRLYGPSCGLEEFMVLSQATGNYYKYSSKTNKIEIVEL